MEFYVNFGLAGLLAGMFALGWLLRVLDRAAALAGARGDRPRLVLLYLPAAALVQPIGSLVELAGGAAAGLVAGWCWGRAWQQATSRAGARGGIQHTAGSPR
jgi:hypothetical protein